MNLAREVSGDFLFRLASLCTDPICKSHEIFTYLKTPYHRGEFGHSASKVSEYSKRCFLVTQLGLLTPFAASLGTFGMGARFLGILLKIKSHTHLHSKTPEKTLENNTFSLFSFNACFIGGGYPLTHGGVRPWKKRVEAISQKILKLSPDITALLEVYDLKAAYSLYNRLKDHYTHFYFNIGPQNIGSSSGLFVASKFAVDHPEFIPFSPSTLLHEGEFVKKGFFAFNLKTKNHSFARIYLTHLQHSQNDAEPSSEETCARKEQIDHILCEINSQKKKDQAIILTGDLNLDKKEYDLSPLSKNFANDYLQQSDHEGTCLRDGFNHYLWKNKEQNFESFTLDHTLLYKNPGQSHRNRSTISTKRIASYEKHRPDLALSDHDGLFSRVTIKPNK